MNLDRIIALRHTLHAAPEVSGREVRTRAILIDFLQKNTTLDLFPCGDGFCAAHREAGSMKSTIALRADYDALAMPDGTASHLCGHDGHAAALCGAAMAVEGEYLGRNVFFLFQPAEETGTGASGCAALFDREEIGEIYGAHNLPGWPLGQVTTCPGTFACASRGLSLRFGGKPTHAAYPEHGISPAPAVGQLLCAIPELSSSDRYTGMTLCTVIGVEMGEKAFGAAAAEAEVWLTLRAEHDCDLAALHAAILKLGNVLAKQSGLTFSYHVQDVFPATENTPDCAQKVIALCDGVPLETPMRWSEDFGHYLKRCPGAFFGIGAGVDHPPLHTADYSYPDTLLAPTVSAFLALIRG